MNIPDFQKISVPLSKVDIRADLPDVKGPFVLTKTSLEKMEKEVVVAVMMMGAIKAGGWTALSFDNFIALMRNTTPGHLYGDLVINNLLIMEQDGYVIIDRKREGNKQSASVSPTQKLADVFLEKNCRILKFPKNNN